MIQMTNCGGSSDNYNEYYYNNNNTYIHTHTFILSNILLPSSIASTMELKRSSCNIISEADLATSVPVIPIAIPIDACWSAGASFTPSPVVVVLVVVVVVVVTISKIQYNTLHYTTLHYTTHTLHYTYQSYTLPLLIHLTC